MDDISDKDLKEKIRRTVEGIDTDIKTETLVYEKRLVICKDCNKLLNGMCRLCGCFVEVRAAVQTQACPNRKW